LKQIDPVVNFEWAANEYIIPNVAFEWVSIEWIGYIKPAATGDHYFKVEADDGVRVYVNDKLVIDIM